MYPLTVYPPLPVSYLESRLPYSRRNLATSDAAFESVPTNTRDTYHTPAMEYNAADDNKELYTSDSVQWQGSQSACAALDSLFSEASFRSQPELFRIPRDSARASSTSSECTMKGILYSHRQPSPLASTSPSPSTCSSMTSSDSSSVVTSDTTSSTTSNSNRTNDASTWKVSANDRPNDRRSRLSRPSTSVNVETLPVRDPDQFLSMLKGISERIDGNIRNDTSSPRDTLKRRQPSKRVASASDIATKRVRHDTYSKPSNRSASESTAKGKARDFGTPACISIDMSTPPVRTAGVARNLIIDQDDANSAMDVDSPRPSCEVMPPPPVPPKPRTAAAPSISDTPNCPPSHPPSICIASAAEQNVVISSSSSLSYMPRVKPPTHAKDAPTKPKSTPAQTPKLHPLLDPERKQRRIRFERTVSVSLTSLSSEPSLSSNPPSQNTSRHTPQVRQPQQPQPHCNRQSSALSFSQGRFAGNDSRPPPLGMRRTHTFPLSSQNSSTTGGQSKTGFPMKQKSFKPPLLSSSQPPSTSPTNSLSSGSSIPSNRSCSSKTTPPTSTDSPCPKPGGGDGDDLPPNSDAELSFGDVVPLDVDMDVLEEAMRKYD